MWSNANDYVQYLEQKEIVELISENCRKYLDELVHNRNPSELAAFYNHILCHGGVNLCLSNEKSKEYLLITTRYKKDSTEHESYSLFFDEKIFPDRKKSLFLAPREKAEAHASLLKSRDCLFYAFPYDSCKMAGFVYNVDRNWSESFDIYPMMCEFFSQASKETMEVLYKKYEVSPVKSTTDAEMLMEKLSSEDIYELRPYFEKFINDKIKVGFPSFLLKEKARECWCSGKVALIRYTEKNLQIIQAFLSDWWIFRTKSIHLSDAMEPSVR